MLLCQKNEELTFYQVARVAAMELTPRRDVVHVLGRVYAKFPENRVFFGFYLWYCWFSSLHFGERFARIFRYCGWQCQN